MNIVEKLIAGGLEQSEAERIAALLEEQTDPETEETTPETPEAGEAEKSGEMSEVEAPKEAEAPNAPAGRASVGVATAINAPDVSALTANLMSAEIRSCALECGVDARRMPALIRLVDTAAIDPAAKNLHEQVMAAVKSALKEVPELVRGGTASGSLGNHARVLTGADDVAAKFRSGF